MYPSMVLFCSLLGMITTYPCWTELMAQVDSICHSPKYQMEVNEFQNYRLCYAASFPTKRISSMTVEHLMSRQYPISSCL